LQIGPTNSEVGAAWTAYILGELYTDWPRRRDFNCMDVGHAVDISPRVDAEELFDDLLMCLRDNGFVSFNQAAEGNAFDVALTEKGFAILGKRSIESERSLGTRMYERRSDNSGKRRWSRYCCISCWRNGERNDYRLQELAPREPRVEQIQREWPRRHHLAASRYAARAAWSLRTAARARAVTLTMLQSHRS
jgi:hypothetical protein